MANDLNHDDGILWDLFLKLEAEGKYAPLFSWTDTGFALSSKDGCIEGSIDAPDDMDRNICVEYFHDQLDMREEHFERAKRAWATERDNHPGPPEEELERFYEFYKNLPDGSGMDTKELIMPFELILRRSYRAS